MQAHSIEVFPRDCTEFNFLFPSIQSMFEAIDIFVDGQCHSGEIWLPYWSNERAMLSQFIGGVWRADSRNYAIEEYSCTKGQTQSKYKGRRDAWFCIDGEKCYAEAKLPRYSWPSARQFKERYASANLECALAEAGQAEADAKNSDRCRTVAGVGRSEPNDFGLCHNPASIRCLGIIFVVPRISERYQAEADAILESYADATRAAATAFAEYRNCRILWARYLRRSLCSEFFFSDYWGTNIAMPEFDELVSKRLDDGVQASQV